MKKVLPSTQIKNNQQFFIISFAKIVAIKVDLFFAYIILYCDIKNFNLLFLKKFKVSFIFFRKCDFRGFYKSKQKIKKTPPKSQGLIDQFEEIESF